MLNDDDKKEYQDWITLKKNEINPITGKKNLCKDITDYDVWAAGQVKLKLKVEAQEKLIKELQDEIHELKEIYLQRW
jgi:predicted transport protein